MYNDKQLSSIADEIVKTAVKRYEGSGAFSFALTIMGSGKFKLESFPGAGHNFYVILEAIYKYYNYDKRISNMLSESLEYLCDFGPFKIEGDYLLLNFINLILNKQKLNEAPFNIDCIILLEKFKIRVKNGIEQGRYENIQEYNELLDKYGKNIEENIGYKIL